jgi:hypothetical protein
MLMIIFFLHNFVFALSHLEIEDDDSDTDKTGLGIQKENGREGEGEWSSTVEGGTRTIDGLGGAEVVFVDVQPPNVDLQERSTTPEC